MAGIVLTAIVVIAIALVAVALLVWRRQNEEKPEEIGSKRKKAFFAQWIIGIVIALTAAGFMFDGDILGQNTTGISTVMGIVGISLIATSNVNLLPGRRR
jgi:amino acid transporter